VLWGPLAQPGAHGIGEPHLSHSRSPSQQRWRAESPLSLWAGVCRALCQRASGALLSPRGRREGKGWETQISVGGKGANLEKHDTFFFIALNPVCD